jgi:hypothetical protein
MLLPVGAVSAVSLSIEKPVVATAETSGLQTTATPLAVLSSAVNVSVEGKLNMLLVAARERMLDSLLSAIDTAAQAVNVSREPGESNAAYAQRVATAIRSLTSQQLVVAQQRVDGQIKTPVPLPLLAEALEDPESPQAVQLALSLEQASAAEPDAVLKAVVNSYGQNAGNAEMPGPLASAPLQKAADLAALATALATAAEEPAAPTATQQAAQPTQQPAPASQQTAPSGVPVQSAPNAAEAASAQTMAQSGAAAGQQAVPAATSPQTASAAANGTAASAPQASQLASLVDDLAVGTLLTAIAAEAELPTEVALIRSPLSPPPVPRDIQQIEADIKQGLQVVISPPAMANNSDLLQIISNPSSSAEKIIAQALMGNAAAQASSPQSPSINENVRNPASATAVPVALTEQLEASSAAAALSGKTPAPAPSAVPMALYEAAEQAGTSTPLPLGVPFVVANYLPADPPVKDGDAKPLNRVDPVGDEEGGQAEDEEQQPQDQDKDEDHAGESAAQAGEEGFDESEVRPVPSQGDAARSELAALPQPLRDPLHDHAFDFYRRMVAWE